MRTSTHFYPESNKRSPTSDDPVTCPLGSSHGLICSSAQLGGGPLRLCPWAMPSAPVAEGVRRAETVDMWSELPLFLGPGVAAAKNSSLPYCAGGMRAQLLTWTAKCSFSLLRWLFLLVLLFLFLVSVCAYFSIGWNRLQKDLPLSCLARRPLLCTHRWVFEFECH